jgi:type IV secretory pathway component VirB8
MEKPQLTWVAGASVAYKKVTVRYTYISTPSKNVSNSNGPLGFRVVHMVTLDCRW